MFFKVTPPLASNFTLSLPSAIASRICAGFILSRRITSMPSTCRNARTCLAAKFDHTVASVYLATVVFDNCDFNRRIDTTENFCGCFCAGKSGALVSHNSRRRLLILRDERICGQIALANVFAQGDIDWIDTDSFHSGPAGLSAW